MEQLALFALSRGEFDNNEEVESSESGNGGDEPNNIEANPQVFGTTNSISSNSLLALSSHSLILVRRPYCLVG